MCKGGEERGKLRKNKPKVGLSVDSYKPLQAGSKVSPTKRVVIANRKNKVEWTSCFAGSHR